MRLHDAGNAERMLFFNFSAKNCRVFGADNFKNRRRKRKNMDFKMLLRKFESSTRRQEDKRSF